MRRKVIDPAIAEHRARIVKTTGDGMLAEFQSVVVALRRAAAWQAAVPADSLIAGRIDIHQGGIVVENAETFGDGVNVRGLEALAEPGSICVSARVHFLGKRFDEAIPQLILAIQRIRATLCHIACWRRGCRSQMARPREPAQVSSLQQSAGR